MTTTVRPDPPGHWTEPVPSPLPSDRPAGSLIASATSLDGEAVTLSRALSWLQDARTVETDPDHRLPVRLHRAAAAVLEPGPGEVVVEVSAIEGRYARHRRWGKGPSPRAPNRLYASDGAIIAAATGSARTAWTAARTSAS